MDNEVRKILLKEANRQKTTIELIASENFVSQEVLEMNGSIFTNKYAEGYPNNRYYDGCAYVDELEILAIERAKKLFGVNYVNVQPHSGSQANAAVYNALIKPGDKILGMSLESGGHLTHGYKISFSGIFYDSYFYDVNRDSETLDMDEIERLALKIMPKLIIAGASSYSRIIDFKRFREIANKINAYLVVDMAHIAGLVAAGIHPSPVKYAHAITSTTHKTLRGARGGLILTNDKDIAHKIDKSVFPGIQGGPLMNIIAGKAVAFGEALTKEYKDYIYNVVENSKYMSDEFKKRDVRIVSGFTENHLFMIDVKKSYDITGSDASTLLNSINIIVNKNTIPFDTLKPSISSGIRIGTAAMTTHGFGKKEFGNVVSIIDTLLRNKDNKVIKEEMKQKVKELLKR